MGGNPVPKAINHRVMPLGVPWTGFMITLCLAVIVYAAVDKRMGFSFLLITLFVLRLINKREPRFFRALWLWWKWGRHTWDAGRLWVWR